MQDESWHCGRLRISPDEFVSADAPCFALGMVAEGKRRCGFVALGPDKVIPREVSNGGFRFGHGMLVMTTLK
jgi:hypothetical protein